MSRNLAISAMRFYPKRLGSSLVGWAAELRLPMGMRDLILGTFAHCFGIDLDEAEKPLRDYPSLQAFFTRRLKPGLRPQDKFVPGALNSPVDGRIIAHGRVEGDTLIQAKGIPYRLSELLKHDPDSKRFEGSHYLALYLSPRDYHRIHVPCSGRVRAVGHVEGELWPVNDASTDRVPRLYERNRRATWIAVGEDQNDGLEIAVVLVGATHVGGVLIDAQWRQDRVLPRDGMLTVPDLLCAPGDDLGTFAFGSTVILIVGGPRSSEWQASRTEGTVQVGQRLGAFN